MKTSGQKKSNLTRREVLLGCLKPLAKACPVDGCNPEDCPLHKVRKMTLPSRLKWFKTLTEEDLVYLATYHHVCFNTKMEHTK